MPASIVKDFRVKIRKMFQLYNTLSGKKEEFKTIEPNKVGMYACGPTVYDYDHLGHARTYLSFDLLNRFLKHLGYEVNYVQNLTDVGNLVGDAESGTDKVQQKAQETGQTARQIVEHFTAAHLKDMADLNILPPTTQPAASEHINEIIEFIEELIKKGFAYVSPSGNVYFSVAKKHDYGKLSHRGLTEILTGTRIESAADKRSNTDFALWKAAPTTINEMTWNSPWGRGYPGWHIECSAMSLKYLGETFDIHGSGLEHIFPHHENEIAQSESLTGKPMANYWVHTGMLSVNGQKMSKSLRNTVTIQDALKQYSSNELRLAFFLSHYRKPFDYTKESMEQGKALRSKLFIAYANSQGKPDSDSFNLFTEALENDLDTPKALSLLSDHCEKLSKEQLEETFETIGLRYISLESNESLMKLSDERDIARTTRDYLTADNRKAEIEQAGYEVIDTPGKSIYLPR